MFSWLYKRISKKKNSAGPIPSGEICRHPECDKIATDQWLPAVCALRESNISVDWVAVCAEHDIMLNEATIRTIFGSEYDSELAQYRERRTPEKG